MARSVINVGAFADDPSAESIRSAFQKINDMTDELYLSIVGHNVLAYGAAGDYNDTTDTGTDDTAAIQAAYDAAASNVSIKGIGAVCFPSNRNYKITSTITIEQGVHTFGIGGLSGRNTPTGAEICWRGSNGGLMFDVDNTSGSVFGVRFQNIVINGGPISAGDGSGPMCGNAVQIPAGAADSGTDFENVWFRAVGGNCIHLTNGATNCFVNGGRMDVVAGYGIYMNTAGGNGILQVHDMTYTNWPFPGASPQSNGFIYIDGTTANGTFSNVHLTGINCEVAGPFNVTHAAGTNRSDQSGLIRLGINPSTVFLQHVLSVDSFTVSPRTDTASFSFIQCTSSSGTLAQHANRVRFTLRQGKGMASEITGPTSSTGTVKLYGNVPTAFEYPHSSSVHVMECARSGDMGSTGQNPRSDVHMAFAPTFSAIHLRTYTVANLPSSQAEGTRCAVSDSSVAMSGNFGATVAGGGTQTAPVIFSEGVWKIG